MRDERMVTSVHADCMRCVLQTDGSLSV
jgi:hypothetical protein